MNITDEDAEKMLPHLDPREFRKELECVDMSQFMDMLMLQTGHWQAGGWAYTKETELPKYRKYVVMYVLGKDKQAWIMVLPKVFHFIVDMAQSRTKACQK